MNWSTFAVIIGLVAGTFTRSFKDHSTTNNGIDIFTVLYFLYGDIAVIISISVRVPYNLANSILQDLQDSASYAASKVIFIL